MEHCKQISLAYAHKVPAALGLPPLTVCVLSQSSTAQAPGCSAWNCLRWALGCVHFPGLSHSGSGCFSGTPQRLRLGWTCLLCTFPVRAAQATRCLASTVTPRCGASYHLLHPSHSVSWVSAGVPVSGRPCVSSGELIPGCNPLGGCQPPRILRSLG